MRGVAAETEFYSCTLCMRAAKHGRIPCSWHRVLPRDLPEKRLLREEISRRPRGEPRHVSRPRDSPATYDSQHAEAEERIGPAHPAQG